MAAIFPDHSNKNCPKLSLRAVSLAILLADSYFFLRLIKPVTSEPRPSSPSRGSGEAVCGRFFSPAFAFWSAEAAFWSAVELLGEAAFWSVLLGAVELAGGFCAVVVLLEE